MPIDDAGNPIEPAKWKEDLIDKINGMNFSKETLDKWLPDIPDRDRTDQLMRLLLIENLSTIFKLEP